MAWKKPEFSLEESIQEIDLKDYFPTDISQNSARKFADLLINKMIERTQDGKQITGHKFKKYSEKYAEEKGVDINSVNMTLEGDMLLSARKRVLEKDKINLLIDEKTQALKSYNHNTGDTLPKRAFFGVRESEIKEIASEIIKDIPKDKLTKNRIARKINELTERISPEEIIERIRLETE